MDAPRIDSERTTSDLRFCREQFDSIRSDLMEFAYGLRASQLSWRPDQSTWSIAQCIEHLNSATEHDLARLGVLVVLARASRAQRPHVDGRQPRAPLLSLLDSPRHTLTNTTALRAAPVVRDVDSVVSRFLELNRGLIRVIDEATAVATHSASRKTTRVLLDHAGHILQLNALHHWRFILLARRVKERPGFPRR